MNSKIPASQQKRPITDNSTPIPMIDRLNSDSDRPRQIDPNIRERVVIEIDQNDSFVLLVLQWLYERQTHVERATRRTIDRNRVGFDSVDARIFAPMAEAIVPGAPLSSGNLEVCR